MVHCFDVIYTDTSPSAGLPYFTPHDKQEDGGTGSLCLPRISNQWHTQRGYGALDLT